MGTAVIVIVLTLFAVAMIPAMIGYYLWLDRTVLPRLLRAPTRLARTILAVCIALPWIVSVLIAWLVRG